MISWRTRPSVSPGVALGICLLLSLLLHKALWVFFEGWLTTPVAPIASPAKMPNDLVIRVMLDGHAVASPRDPNPASPPPKVPVLDVRKQSDVPRATGFNTTTYYVSSELQMRAAPVNDWIVNKKAIPKGQLAVLQFTVWISATGAIDHVVVENAALQPAWAAQALATIRETPMEPALLNNKPVASTMTIEVVMDNVVE